MRILLAVALIAAVQAQSLFNWEESPYENRDFNVKAEYGDDLTLLCNDTRLWAAGEFMVKKWILPSLEIMYPNDTIIFQSLDGPSGWSVQNDGKDMEITLVQGEHFGPYYCIAELDDQSEIVVKVGINMWGPDYGDVWNKYKDAIGWASGLTAAFTAACTIAFVLYTRNEGPEVSPAEEEEEEEIAQAKAFSSAIFENKAFTGSNGNMSKHSIEETVNTEVETSAL